MLRGFGTTGILGLHIMLLLSGFLGDACINTVFMLGMYLAKYIVFTWRRAAETLHIALVNKQLIWKNVFDKKYIVS